MSLLFALLVLVGSAALSWVVVGQSIRVAHRHGLMDHPDGGRKTQSQPIPRLGGLAVALAMTVAAVGVLWATRRESFLEPALAVLLPALLAAGVGYLDDLRHLRPILRLGLQAGLGLLAWVLGTRIAVTGWWPIDLLVTVLWFMVIVNGVNLLDNSDGLAGTTVLVASLGATLVALILGQVWVAALGLALIGVCAGFLGHNWNPARVYMGDSGAYFLGFLLASLIVLLRPATVDPWVGVVIALLLASLPIIDTTYVVVRRLRVGVHPFTAGRDHLAHVLQDRGVSVPGSVLTLQVILFTTAAGAVGIAVLQQARLLD